MWFEIYASEESNRTHGVTSSHEHGYVVLSPYIHVRDNAIWMYLYHPQEYVNLNSIAVMNFFEWKKEEQRKTCTYYRRERSKKPTQGCSTIIVCITLTAYA